MQNACKRAWTKMVEKRQERKEKKRKGKREDDDMPEFLQ
jgi:hypothetical protein